MSKSKKNVERRVRFWMISWRRNKMLLLSSVRAYSKRKDSKLSLNYAHKIKQGMNSILLLWIISSRISRKWSTLKKTTWNSSPKSWSLEKHSMRNKMHSSNNARTIVELSRRRLRNIFNKKLNFKTKSRT